MTRGCRPTRDLLSCRWSLASTGNDRGKLHQAWHSIEPDGNRVTKCRGIEETGGRLSRIWIAVGDRERLWSPFLQNLFLTFSEQVFCHIDIVLRVVNGVHDTSHIITLGIPVLQVEADLINLSSETIQGNQHDRPIQANLVCFHHDSDLPG